MSDWVCTALELE